MPHLAEDHVAVDLERGVEASFLSGLQAVECDLDPVLAAFVDTRFAQGVFCEGLVDYDSRF